MVDVSAPEPAAEGCSQETDLKEIIVDAIANTKTWDELAGKLAEKNILLAAKGGGLVVKNAAINEEICKISALGFKYVNLIRHYGDGFPDHHATWLVERVFNDNYVPKNPKRSQKAKIKKKRPGGDDDFSLVED